MQKSKSFFTAVILAVAAIMLLSGCQVSSPGGDYPILANENVVENGAVELSRTTTKVVTAYEQKTMELPYDMIDSVLNSIRSGSMSKEYNDGVYKGTLKSVAASLMSSSPIQTGTVMRRCVINITFRGTVTRVVPYPPTKTVTAYEQKTMELPYDMIDSVLNSIRKGSMSKEYNDGVYKGSIKSVAATLMSSSPVQTGTVMRRCVINITYKGTVALIAPQPESKSVTIYEDKSVTIPEDMLPLILNSLSSGVSKEYNDGVYKGTLKSRDAKVVTKVPAPGLPGDFRYTIRVTYEGTVYKIK